MHKYIYFYIQKALGSGFQCLLRKLQICTQTLKLIQLNDRAFRSEVDFRLLPLLRIWAFAI